MSRDNTSESSALLVKFRGLQSIMFILSYTDTPHLDLISKTAEMMSQAVSSNVPRIYTGDIDHAQATWNTIEIRELATKMKKAGEEKLAELEALYHEAFHFLIPADRAEWDEAQSLAESDLAWDVMWSTIDHAQGLRHVERINEALSNRIQTAQHERIDVAVRALELRIGSLEGWMSNLGAKSNRAGVRMREVQETFKVQQQQGRRVDQTKAPQGRPIPDRTKKPRGQETPNAATDDEAIARNLQEKEYDKDPPSGEDPVERFIREEEGRANPEWFKETTRRYKEGELQISDQAVAVSNPTLRKTHDPEVGREDDDEIEDEEMEDV